LERKLHEAIYRTIRLGGGAEGTPPKSRPDPEPADAPGGAEGSEIGGKEIAQGLTLCGEPGNMMIPEVHRYYQWADGGFS
jgi:hypothetical protein